MTKGTAQHRASVIIDAPLDQVWDLTNDPASWTRLMGDYAAVDVLDTSADATTVRVALRPDARGAAHGWTAQHRPDRVARTVHAHHLDGHAFDAMDSHWHYRQRAEGVELEWVHEFRVAAAMPYTDEAMVGMMEQIVPRRLAHLKEEVERACGAGLHVLLRIEVTPGREADFEREWRDIAAGIARQPGQRAQRLLRVDGEESSYVVLSDWADAASFDAFEHSAEHVGNRARIDAFRRSGSMTTLIPVATLRGVSPSSPVTVVS